MAAPPKQLNSPTLDTAPNAPHLAMFTRSLAPESYEILALSGLDAVVFDVEHGIFDRSSLSRCVFTAKAGGLMTFVRLPATNRTDLQCAVGLGIDGLIVSHIADATEAGEIARFVRGACVARAHAGATRASQYREAEWTTFATEASRMTLLVQIDDAASVTAAAQLAGIVEFDGVFLGRMGLLLDLNDELAADQALCSVCTAFNGRFIGISTGIHTGLQKWQQRGARLFVVDSDQRLLLAAARERVAAFEGMFANHKYI